MVDIKISKVWLIRENRGSNIYYLTGDPEFVKWFKTRRRHWGNLVWERGLVEDKKYSYSSHLWLLKTYLIILSKIGCGWYLTPLLPNNVVKDHIETNIGNGQYRISPKYIFEDTYRFDFGSNYYSKSIIKSFRNKLRFIEGVVWNYRNFLNGSSLDYPNLQFLIEPRRGLPKDPQGPYDLWSTKKETTPPSRLSRILNKIRAAF